jgi:hypothetical protein
MAVAVGLTLVVPVADVEVKVPGVMAMLVAPVVAQLSVLLVPELMLVGFAVKEAIVGAEPFTTGGFVEPQPVSSTQINRIRRTSAQLPRPGDLRPQSHVRAFTLASVCGLPFASYGRLPPGVDVRSLDWFSLCGLVPGRLRILPPPW